MSVQTAIQQLVDVERESLSIVTTCVEGLQQAAIIVQSHQVSTVANLSCHRWQSQCASWPSGVAVLKLVCQPYLVAIS